ncbi:MAG: sugar-specific transcriptional regulator TrmB [Candidatus Nanohaloarchaea archaeon]|jgi:sugar-specific transcriptional regulator TrmB
MVASQETLDKLEDIGLNMYERKIYSALISRGVSTAGELSEMTNVPRSRAYDVLESLAEKGFAVIKSNQPMEYVAIPPEQAIENIKSQHRKELEEKLQKLDTFKDSEAVDELESLYDQGLELVEPEEMSGSLKGSHQINQHMGTMFQDAEESIKIVTSEEGLNDLYENHSDLLKSARENGVNVKVLAPVTDKNRDSFEEMKEFSDVRHLQGNDFDVPEGRFAIIDNDALTMSMTHDEVHETQDTAFWTKSDHMAEQTMDPVFDMLWEHSEEEPDNPGDKGPERPE